jgi:outer membrane usher protein FimD/PapC
MFKKYFQIVLAVLVIALVTLACEFSASTASIESATLTNDETNVVSTQVFSQADVFYCVVVTKNAPDDTTLKAVWVAVEADGVEANTTILEKEMVSGSDTITFTLSNDNLWPLGRYKVDLYLNDELDQSIEFTVE